MVKIDNRSEILEQTFAINTRDATMRDWVILEIGKPIPIANATHIITVIPLLFSFQCSYNNMTTVCLCARMLQQTFKQTSRHAPSSLLSFGLVFQCLSLSVSISMDVAAMSIASVCVSLAMDAVSSIFWGVGYYWICHAGIHHRIWTECVFLMVWICMGNWTRVRWIDIDCHNHFLWRHHSN